MSMVDRPADLERGARPVNARSWPRRLAMIALAVIGATLGFASGLVLILASGLVALC